MHGDHGFSLIYRNINQMEDYRIEWLKETIQKFVKKKAKIIELGCGTGNYLINLLKSGFIVDALDSSDIMISIVKKNIENISEIKDKSNINLFKMNMLKFINPNRYNLIYNKSCHLPYHFFITFLVTLSTSPSYYISSSNSHSGGREFLVGRGSKNEKVG